MASCATPRVNKWLFLVIAILVTMLEFGLIFAFGAVFVALLDTFNRDRLSTATVQSLLVGITLSFGIVSGTLITTLGLPIVTFISAILVPLGFFASYFASSIEYLCISIGIVSGTGISLGYFSAIVVVGRVFTGRQKVLCLAIQTACNAVAGIIYPYVLDWLLKVYGLKGTFLILGALLSNGMVFFILCLLNRKAVSDTGTREKEKEQDKSDAKKGVSDTGTRENENDPDKSDAKKGVSDTGTREKEKEQDKSDAKKAVSDTGTREKEKEQDRSDANKGVSDTGTHEKEKEHDKSDVKKAVSNNGAQEKESIKSGLNAKVTNSKSDKPNHNGISDKNAIKKVQATLLNGIRQLRRLMSKPYVFMLIAQLAALTGLNGYIGLILDISRWKGFVEAQGLSSFVFYNIANVISRLMPGLLKQKKGVNSFIFPIASCLAGCAGQLIVYFGNSYATYVIGTSLIGAATGGNISAVVVLVVQVVCPDQVPIGTGLLFTVTGFATVAIGSVFGGLRDKTGSYGSVILTVALLQVVGIMFYTLALLSRRQRKVKKLVPQIPKSDTVFAITGTRL